MQVKGDVALAGEKRAAWLGGILLIAAASTAVIFSLVHRVSNTMIINQVCAAGAVRSNTIVQFTWPNCSTFDVVLGFPKATLVKPVKGRFLVYEAASQLLCADFDVKNATACNWLEKHGIDGRVLTLSADGQKVLLDSILRHGRRYRCVVEFIDSPGNDLSLWFVYTQKWKYRHESMGVKKL